MDIILPVLCFAAGVGLGFLLALLKSGNAKNQSEEFLKLAETRFQTLQAQSAGDLDKRTLAVSEMVKPVNKQLEALNAAIQQITGTDKSLAEQITGLQRETARIAGALNNPRERGRSAEILLERLFEHAGLIRDVHYRVQAAQGNIRPDFVIELEDSLRVVIDAKAPLIEVMDDLEDPDRQKDAAKKLAYQVREHIKSLSGKSYTDITGSVDFTVLFLPGDGLYALAVDADRDLIDFAARHNIILSSPMLLFGLLRMIHQLGRERALNRNAEDVRKLGADLHKRLAKFFEHFENIGKSLQTASRRYDEAVGSMNRMVLPAARKFEEMQAIPGTKSLKEPTSIEGPRAVSPESVTEENVDDKAA